MQSRPKIGRGRHGSSDCDHSVHAQTDRSFTYRGPCNHADKRVRSAQARERSEKDRGVAMTNYSLASTSCLVLSCLVLSCGACVCGQCVPVSVWRVCGLRDRDLSVPWCEVGAVGVHDPADRVAQHGQATARSLPRSYTHMIDAEHAMPLAPPDQQQRSSRFSRPPHSAQQRDAVQAE
jgi:hypothetical protein